MEKHIAKTPSEKQDKWKMGNSDIDKFRSFHPLTATPSTFSRETLTKTAFQNRRDPRPQIARPSIDMRSRPTFEKRREALGNPASPEYLEAVHPSIRSLRTRWAGANKTDNKASFVQA